MWGLKSRFTDNLKFEWQKQEAWVHKKVNAIFTEEERPLALQFYFLELKNNRRETTIDEWARFDFLKQELFGIEPPDYLSTLAEAFFRVAKQPIGVVKNIMECLRSRVITYKMDRYIKKELLEGNGEIYKELSEKAALLFDKNAPFEETEKVISSCVKENERRAFFVLAYRKMLILLHYGKLDLNSISVLDDGIKSELAELDEGRGWGYFAEIKERLEVYAELGVIKPKKELSREVSPPAPTIKGKTFLDVMERKGGIHEQSGNTAAVRPTLKAIEMDAGIGKESSVDDVETVVKRGERISGQQLSERL